jgi:hypothetical protein
MKKCPNCKKQIQDEAVKCKHCNQEGNNDSLDSEDNPIIEARIISGTISLYENNLRIKRSGMHGFLSGGNNKEISISNIAQIFIKDPIIGNPGVLTIKQLGNKKELIHFNQNQKNDVWNFKGKLEDIISGGDLSKKGEIRCPKCGSSQITANKQGYKVGRAVGVGLLTFGIGGLVAGAIGAGNVNITCLNCGNTWRAGT